jgi:hypothetical protein
VLATSFGNDPGMWLFGGTKSKTRPIAGGRVGKRYCEGCKAVVTFRECTIADQVHLFFVSLLDTESRRMVCAECGEDHDVNEFFASERIAVPPKSRAPEKAPASRREPTDGEIDAELAALKRRLGKAD